MNLKWNLKCPVCGKKFSRTLVEELQVQKFDVACGGKPCQAVTVKKLLATKPGALVHSLEWVAA